MLAAWGCRLANQEPIGCCSARRQVVRIHGRARSALRFVHKPAINHKFGNSRQLISPFSPAKRPAFTAARTHCRVSMRFSPRKHTPQRQRRIRKNHIPSRRRSGNPNRGPGLEAAAGQAKYFEEDAGRCFIEVRSGSGTLQAGDQKQELQSGAIVPVCHNRLSPLRTAANLQWRCECTSQPERRPSASAIPTRRFKLRPDCLPLR